MSPSLSLTSCLALVAICSIAVCEGYISVPLTGYQQGIKLQITPPASTAEECYVYGVPTPYGYAPSGPTPLSVYTYKNTGSHVIEFEYKTSDYDLAPVFIPGDTIIQVDTSNPLKPLVKFDSNQSPQGKYAYISVQLQDKNKNQLCVSNIALAVDAPLSCLPTWGGYYDVINPVGPTVVIPSTGGKIVVPGGNVYAPTYVQNTVIQQFLTINNVNINNINIVNNVVAITNVTIIQNVTAPPTPPPINCTTTPSAPACQNSQRTAGPTSAVRPPQAATPSNSINTIPAIITPAGPQTATRPPATPTAAPPTTTTTGAAPTTGQTAQTVQPPARAPAATPPPTTPTTSSTPPPTTSSTVQPPARAPTATTTGRRFRA